MMMKRSAVFALLLPLAAAVFGNALDVREFGAKGDGRHDDAPAFRKAFKEAFVRRTSNNTAESTREIFIPAGRYRLGSTLIFRQAEHYVLPPKGTPRGEYRRSSSEGNAPGRVPLGRQLR